MTNEELDRLDALADKATPGPWHDVAIHQDDESGVDWDGAHAVLDGPDWDNASRQIVPFSGPCNAAFIASASPDVVLALTKALREAWANYDTIARAYAEEDSEQWARERDALRADIRELQRNALPSNCTRCGGRGSDPPHCPESGPCERCGGWTAHKRLVAAEHAQLREEIRRLTEERDGAVRRAESAELGCSITYEREPTQAEGDAHEFKHGGSIPECHVVMGDHHGHRCRCGRWVWGGPTVCQRCVDADAVKIALEWKTEFDRLRKLFDDAGQGEHNVLALVDHYQRAAMESNARLMAVRVVLEKNGCNCECEHHWEDHDGECDRCLACLVAGAMGVGS